MTVDPGKSTAATRPMGMVAGSRAADSELHGLQTRHVAVEPSSPIASISPTSTEQSIAEWDAALRTLKARLTEAAASMPQEVAGAGDPVPLDAIRDDVLECVEVLDIAHATLLRDLDRCRRLEEEVADTRQALARTLAELAGTKAGERRARHLALHDGLTELPNRRYFQERLAETLASCSPERSALAVLYLDLDEFKPINDAHGHDMGDKLLRIVAARLTRAVRSDDMVSRLGGDEFACLIQNPLDRGQLVSLARKMFEAVSAPLTVGELDLTVRPSIGIAVYPADGTTAEALLESADAAMYRAKRDRTGHALFDLQTDS